MRSINIAWDKSINDVMLPELANYHLETSKDVFSRALKVTIILWNVCFLIVKNKINITFCKIYYLEKLKYEQLYRLGRIM